MMSYQDITGRIDFSETKTIMIQADSLSRIAPSCVPDMLVLDEIESILT
jgi:hypothetical protein